ncbi:MAG: sugar phosphate isomerase [Phycisphaerae bacterium]|nr:sugar phosphate isomerase [Phycisphaerae bacterium]NIP51236.1 sugar phosphate isomerase [Phycisphaerae bacterium]NIS50442.1 sugar phosphate isomerase [Phycisphaerae bacterium]NIU08177.1 sugar phosphate isomerase [Phycisphaerae bacterium]NIU54948.1 sugar phosphate isomerase [Phycisphaerae bacterium]
MSDAVEKAKKFLNEEKAFRLGELLTESSHPKTRALSQTCKSNLGDGIRLLQSVDEEIPPAVEKVFQQDTFKKLVETFGNALKEKRRIFFTGCGATGRLSILLETAWRRFWQTLKQKHPDISARLPEMEDLTYSIMAGGDFALIKSVEGFEDFPDFGRFQLKQAGISPGDVVVAITEGGETPFVIGTAWEGLGTKAKVFFVYNNPSEMLQRHVQRSREIIEEPRIAKLDLSTGPMAITGSTRMQATTAELMVVGSALEIALVQFLKENLTASEWEKLGFSISSPDDYHQLLVKLLNHLSEPEMVDTMARLTAFEENIYRRHGLITYMAVSATLDVLTDTTERSPTFMIPPFRKHGDIHSPQSWAFVKNPFLPTQEAWRDMLQREPRGLEWGPDIYKQLNIPAALQANPPSLDNTEIYKFRIGNEPDTSRIDAPDSALVTIAVGDETNHLIDASLKRFGSGYKKTAAIIIGPSITDVKTDELFHFQCVLPDSPLQLWHHIAVKLILNTISTATMALMGRVVGNAMIWLSPSNKKLIDRGSRLISQLTGCSYEQACIELHKAMEEVESRSQQAEEVPSPVALAIEHIGLESDST